MLYSLIPKLNVALLHVEVSNMVYLVTTISVVIKLVGLFGS